MKSPTFFATIQAAGLSLLTLLVAMPTTAFSDTIIADNAFEVFGIAGVGVGPNDGIGDMGVGDTTDPASPGRRGVARFSLAGLAGQTLQSATLNLTIIQSRRNDPGTSGNPCVSPITDGTAPFTNPGLGNTNVLHIADPGTPDATDYQSASIGNDPGTLIKVGVQPPSVVSIDVKAAMQDRIDTAASFVAFRIQTATETDGDGCNDVWFIATEEGFFGAGTEPFILFTTPPLPDLADCNLPPAEKTTICGPSPDREVLHVPLDPFSPACRVGCIAAIACDGPGLPPCIDPLTDKPKDTAAGTISDIDTGGTNECMVITWGGGGTENGRLVCKPHF